MSARRNKLFWGAVAFALLACGADAGEPPASTAVGDLEAAFRSSLEIKCQCPSVQNGTSRAMCIQARLAASGLNACMRSVISRPQLIETIECVTGAHVAESECHLKHECGTDPREACQATFDQAAMACQPWPAALRSQLMACDDGLFHCVGGGSISYDLVCDRTPDCTDGSDEVPC